VSSLNISKSFSGFVPFPTSFIKSPLVDTTLKSFLRVPAVWQSLNAIKEKNRYDDPCSRHHKELRQHDRA
jgi:hypothetical protein